jgi:hypothetical protein
MERRTRREHFSSAALSITDDLLHRSILLLANCRQSASGKNGRSRRFLITQVANLEKVCYYSVRALRMLRGSRVNRSSDPTSDFAHETALIGDPTPRRKI